MGSPQVAWMVPWHACGYKSKHNPYRGKIVAVHKRWPNVLSGPAEKNRPNIREENIDRPPHSKQPKFRRQLLLRDSRRSSSYGCGHGIPSEFNPELSIIFLHRVSSTVCRSVNPGPHDNTVECIITRDRTKSKFRLFLCGGSPPAIEEGKFLLAARKVRRATGIGYIISSNADDMSRARSSTNVIGTLCSNFLNTDYTIYSRQPAPKGAVSSTNRTSGWCTNHKVAHVAYKKSIWGGPYSMECTLHTIPASAIDPNGSAPTSTEFSASTYNVEGSIPFSGWQRSKQSKSAVADCSATNFESISRGPWSKVVPLVFKNIMPRWDDKRLEWVLHFPSGVIVKSVKNFQLVAATEPNRTFSWTKDNGKFQLFAAPEPNLKPPWTKDNGKIFLQFAKIGKDSFAMDYRYPLSPFQAFAIFLSSVDSKWSNGCDDNLQAWSDIPLEQVCTPWSEMSSNCDASRVEVAS